jgi:hypothetical protein
VEARAVESKSERQDERKAPGPAFLSFPARIPIMGPRIFRILGSVRVGNKLVIHYENFNHVQDVPLVTKCILLPSWD